MVNASPLWPVRNPLAAVTVVLNSPGIKRTLTFFLFFFPILSTHSVAGPRRDESNAGLNQS